MLQATDCLLLQFTLVPAPTDRLAAAATQLCADSGLHLQRLARAPDGQAYLYARLPQRTLLGDEALPPLAAALGRRIPAARDIRVARLQQVFTAPGHADGEPPVFHYVVETDPEAGWLPELERWYDQEHMPGLAACPAASWPSGITTTTRARSRWPVMTWSPRACWVHRPGWPCAAPPGATSCARTSPTPDARCSARWADPQRARRRQSMRASRMRVSASR